MPGKLDGLCGSHILKSVKPILTYVNQLQKQLASKQCETKEKEIKEMREKIQELQLKVAEGHLKDDLLLSKDTHIKNLEKLRDDLALSKETRIRDLEKLKDDLLLSKDTNIKNLEQFRDELLLSKDTRIKELEKFRDDQLLSKSTRIKDLESKLSELQKTNNVLDLHFQSVNNEIVELKTFIREELGTVLQKIGMNITKLHSFEDQLKRYEVSSAMKANDANLKSCQTSLDKAQKAVIEYKDICQSAKRDKADQKMQQKEQEINKLKEQLLKYEELANSCSFYGDSNEVNNIKLPHFEAFPVLCNSGIAGPGWTVIQQRINGKEDFNRNWQAYRNGFGNFTGDFFLGLEKIHRLTKNRPHTLYIHMERFDGRTFYARYSNFTIAGEDDKYRLLSLGMHSGTTDKDRMRHSEHQQFTTFDSQNDIYENYNCAEHYRGGWWYRGCADW